jgi:hypothetical protein
MAIFFFVIESSRIVLGGPEGYALPTTDASIVAVPSFE